MNKKIEDNPPPRTLPSNKYSSSTKSMQNRNIATTTRNVSISSICWKKWIEWICRALILFMASILHKRATSLTAVFNRIFRFTFLVSLHFPHRIQRNNKKLLCNKNKLKDYMIYLGIENFIIPFVPWSISHLPCLSLLWAEQNMLHLYAQIHSLS